MGNSKQHNNLGRIALVTFVNPILAAKIPSQQLHTNQPSRKPLLILQKKWLGIFATVLVVTLFFTVSITAIYQNVHAQSLLKNAKTYIAKEQYDTAETTLNKANGFFVIGSTHTDIQNTQKTNKQWIAASLKFTKAKELADQGKYDESNILLKTIDAQFPGHKRVTDLQDTINKKLTELALAAKKAQEEATKLAQAKAAEAARAAQAAKNSRANSSPVIQAKTKKRFGDVSSANSLAAATNIDQALQALQSFGQQYNLAILYSSPSSHRMYNSNVVTNADLAAIKSYGAAFVDEWAKYPKDWVANSGIKRIVFVKDLSVDGTRRAAMPDPITDNLYYDVNYGNGDYAREVLHHEYNHLLMYNYFNSYSPADSVWVSYNPSGFNYGNGGAYCYIPGNSCLSGLHPISGFVSGYAASAIEEDKAETYGYIMTGTYYHLVVDWVKTDSNLAKKIVNYKSFIASHSSEMSGTYFDDINP